MVEAVEASVPFGPQIGTGVRVDGVSIQAPSPLGSFWFPVTSGLTVVYGRNGVGKSRLLTAVGDALRGAAPVVGRSAVHLSLDAYDDSGWVSTLLDRLRVEIADAGASVPEAPSLDALVVPQAAPSDPVSVGSQVTRLANSIDRLAKPFEPLFYRPHIALVPIGNHGRGRWTPVLSMTPKDPLPLCSLVARRAIKDAGPARIDGSRGGGAHLPNTAEGMLRRFLKLPDWGVPLPDPHADVFFRRV